MALLRTCLIAAILLAFSSPLQSAERFTPDQIEFFEKKIRPVLVKQCYRCHSARAQQKKRLRGGLLLDTRQGLLRGGDSGPALVPGKPEASLLLKALRYKDDDVAMPPRGKLDDAIIKDFEKWIADNAPDPRAGPVIAQSGIDWAKAKKHWSFQQPVQAALPQVRDSDWPLSPIDSFVLARLQQHHLQPVAPASRQQLIRRATLDLIGLPPTPEEVEAFVGDTSPDAFAKVVDRLLASPHYGERWGRHWLDVARYAEDQAHTFAVRKKTSAYQYRDWVIHALNKDMPYDRFVQLQVAGDLMNEPDLDRFEQLAGLGFFGLGAEYYKNSDKERALADELDDRIDTMTRGFMGLTVSCARCHDHKFDPIPTQDYYSLAGVFYGSRLTDAPLASAEEVREYNEGQKRIKEHTERIKRWLTEQGRAVSEKAVHHLTQYLTLTWEIQRLQKKKHSRKELANRHHLNEVFLERWVRYLDDRNQRNVARFTPALARWRELKNREDVRKLANDLQRQLLTALQDAEVRGKSRKGKLPKEQEALLRGFLRDRRAPFYLRDRDAERVLTDGQKKVLAGMRAELEQVRKAAPPRYPVVHVISGGGRDLPVYVRGDPARKGKLAPRRFLRILAGEKQEEQGKAFDRLDLAAHLTARDNPLTARVIVNRVWQRHFGQGIVKTASNFGHLGAKPTHPALLDWLTVDFVESGWSLKRLHRRIMLSQTYQLSSATHPRHEEIDADNRFLWRMGRRRLDVESWRDSLLAVAGTLDTQMRGPTFGLDNPSIRRRTVYARISRHQLDSLLRLFDFPDANVTSARRTVTTVPQQQLFILNSVFMVEQARAFAARLQQQAETDEERVRLAHQLTFGRAPTTQEMKLSLTFLAAASAAGKSEAKITAWEQYAQALLSTNEFLYVD